MKLLILILFFSQFVFAIEIKDKDYTFKVYQEGPFCMVKRTNNKTGEVHRQAVQPEGNIGIYPKKVADLCESMWDLKIKSDFKKKINEPIR